MILRRIIAHFRKQEWTAIAIDFVIVVFGVFVGLQVNNWNEARAASRQEAVLIAQLAGDLRSMRESFVFADTIAHDRPHPIAEPFGLNRFAEGRLIDESVAAAVAH